MTKSLIIILFIILAILVGGCSDTNALLKEESKILPDSTTHLKNDLSVIEDQFTGFNYDEIIDHYASKLEPNISITKFRYFVVFSDLGEELTYKLIDTDIRNSVTALESNFIALSPAGITPIILFGDLANYKIFVLSNYKDIPEQNLSQFGFYKISKNVIVVRYVSWKGSIPHEITHKFTNTDFPDMPSWFDEGLASLNEKATFTKNELIGEFSLRIIPLRRAIKENTYTGLEHLMTTNDEILYGKRSSYYYAQSRYLLMMLQQEGKLYEFYKHFRNTFNSDKTGITQLEKITGKSLDTIDAELLDYINSFKDR
jgi:hypothetical protein